MAEIIRVSIRDMLKAFMRLRLRDKLKIILLLLFSILWLFVAFSLLVIGKLSTILFLPIQLDEWILPLIGAVIGALFPWIFMLVKQSIDSILEPVLAVVVERMRLLPHDEFVQKYKNNPHFRGAFTNIRGILIGDIEEFPGELRNALDVTCEINVKLYIPEIPREMIEPFWSTFFKELAKREGMATWYQLKARVKEWNPERIILEGATYLDAYVFHYSADVQLGRKPLREILWPLVMRDGKLVPLKESLLPNHLGVHALLITSDGKMLIPQRSIEVVAAKLAYTVSVEGTVNLPWHPGKRTLKDLIAKEVYYETGLKESEFDAYIISYARGTYVMGRPSVYAIIISKISLNELKKRIPEDKWEALKITVEDLGKSVRDINDIIDKDVLARLESVFNKYSKRYSSPTLIYCLGKLIEEIKRKLAK